MTALRFAWAFSALGFLFYFLATRWTTAVEVSMSVQPWRPIAALTLMVAGKTVYAEVVRLTLKAVPASGGYLEAFYAYSMSQIGKYIPGSIWQFVGRYEIYRGYGVRPGHAVELVLLENALMLVTALFIGTGAALTIGSPLLDFLPPVGWALVLALSAAVLLAVALFSTGVWSRVAALTWTLWRNRLLVVRLIALFFVVWALLGLSAFVLFAHEAAVSPVYMTSLYAFSFAAGFLVVLAPAGVGIREAVLVLGLAGSIQPETALLLAVGHRLLYVLADLVCAGSAWILAYKDARNAHRS